MPGALHHALLGLASLALLAAGHRLAARLTPDPLERAVAAVVLATAAAVIEALALGLVHRGSDPLWLTAAAAATFGLVAALAPAPDPPTHVLLAGRWAALSRASRASAGALAAVALLLVVWPLRFPLIGFDGAVYHLPEIAGWVASGRPAAIEQVSYLFPFANYPITNEVALTWATGIASSLVPLVVWGQILFLLTAAAAWLGLGALGVPRWPRALATAAVLATPVLLTQFGTPSTDVAGLAWLACAGGLAAAARGRPGLAAPALVAAGLAVGTKTTTAPLAVAVVVLLAWGARATIRPPRRVLAAGVAAGALVGATWAVRNALTHGSPLWPFGSLPSGDPEPPVWRLIEPSLASRPRATLDSRVAGYLEQFGGALLLFAGGALAGLAARRRAVLVASAAAVLALVAWTLAPSTGQPDTPVFDANPLATTRYALPAVAAAGVALALAAATATRVGWVARALLVGALAWSLAEAAGLAQPSVPAAWALALAAAAGALGGALTPRAPRGSPAGARAAAVGLAVLAGLALEIPAGGLIGRQAAAAPTIPGTGAVTWARSQPGFETAQRIYFAGTVVGQFAGDRLEHRLVLIDAGASCPSVRARAARSLVVVADEGVFRRLGVRTPAGCLAGMAPAYQDPDVRVYGRLAG